MPLPQGLGVGVPIVDLPTPDAIKQAIEQVEQVTRATWYQTWTAEHDMASKILYTPAVEMAESDLDHAVIARNAGRAWLVLNEVERSLIPLSAWRRTRGWLRRMMAEELGFQWIAPNSNINGSNLIWFTDYAELLAKYGSIAPSAWGIHVYGYPIEAVNHWWQKFWDWWEKHGMGRPVVITEFSAGPNTTDLQNMEILDWISLQFERYKPLAAACFFAARPYVDHNGMVYLGLLDNPALIRAFNRCVYRVEEFLRRR